MMDSTRAAGGRSLTTLHIDILFQTTQAWLYPYPRKGLGADSRSTWPSELYRRMISEGSWAVTFASVAFAFPFYSSQTGRVP